MNNLETEEPISTTEGVKPLKPPFTYFGGKQKVAKVIWSRLGDPHYFIEPFGGSLACLLARPSAPRHELVSDTFGPLTNFWRACKWCPPGELARLVWHMPSELDLYARHTELLAFNGPTLLKTLKSNAKYYDAEYAAWYGWGASMWLGSGWCYRRRDMQNQPDQRQHVNASRGLLTKQWDQHQHGAAGLMNKDVHAKRQHVDNVRGLMCAKPDTLADYLDNLIQRVENNRPSPWLEGLELYFKALQYRLEKVDIFAEDWKRTVTEGILKRGIRRGKRTTAVFMDPPYLESSCDSADLYHSGNVWEDVIKWCRDHEDRTDMRICLAGIEGTASLPGWTEFAWTNSGGAKTKRAKERLWFSPHCLVP